MHVGIMNYFAQFLRAHVLIFGGNFVVDGHLADLGSSAIFESHSFLDVIRVHFEPALGNKF